LAERETEGLWTSEALPPPYDSNIKRGTSKKTHILKKVVAYKHPEDWNEHLNWHLSPLVQYNGICETKAEGTIKKDHYKFSLKRRHL